MHLLTSTATFTLSSPLTHSTVYITSLHARAFYNRTRLIGSIDLDPEGDAQHNNHNGQSHNPPVSSLSPSLTFPVSSPSVKSVLPLAIPPGISTTPPIPIVWNVGGTGYAAIRDALHGELKVDARADSVSVKVGMWKEDELWWEGSGVGAGIRL